MPQKISLTGEKCIIAHLLDESQIRSFLNYFCTEAKLEAEGDPTVTYYQKKMVPEASGFGGSQEFKGGGKIGFGTFPHLDRNGGSITVSINLPQEIEDFQEIATVGIQQFFGALEVIKK